MPTSQQHAVRMTMCSERTLVRAPSRSTRHLLIDIAARDANRDSTRRPTNVGIVLDRSGSMDGQSKFALASHAVAHALNLLQPDDHFTVVVYDNESHVVMPFTLATRDARRITLQRLREIGPRSSCRRLDHRQAESEEAYAAASPRRRP